MRKVFAVFGLMMLIGCSSGEERSISKVNEVKENDSMNEDTDETHKDPSKIISSSSSFSSQSSSSETTKPFTLSHAAPLLAEWTAAWQDFLPKFAVEEMTQQSSNMLSPLYTGSISENQHILTEDPSIPYPTHFPSPDRSKTLYVSPDVSPDSEITLLKHADDIYERLLYCGTPCSWDGAVWVDDDRIAVTGYAEYYPPDGEERCTVDTVCTIVPTLHLINLITKTITLYSGPEVARATFYGME